MTEWCKRKERKIMLHKFLCMRTGESVKLVLLSVGKTPLAYAVGEFLRQMCNDVWHYCLQ